MRNLMREKTLQARGILVKQSGSNNENRYLMIAESFFLKFEPMEKARSVLKLITWANVQSIANIKKSKEEDKLIVLTFIAKEKKVI